MTQLDLLLSGDAPQEKQPVNKIYGLDAVHVSRFAYDKAFRYADLVVRAAGRSVEIGGFLVTPADAQDRIARDAFLARDQDVFSAKYELQAENVIKAKKELEQVGQKILGWWHSHGRKFESYHSPTDDNNQMVVLNEISPSNYVVVPHEKKVGLESRVEGKNLVFWDPDNPATVYHLELGEENPNVVAQNLRVLQQKRIGFAYSMVVNCNRWIKKRVPYCEIATRDVCYSCVSPTDLSTKVEPKIFDEGPFVLDNEKLLAEIKEKVNIGGFHAVREYFFPSTFEERKANGTLTVPTFGDSTYKGGVIVSPGVSGSSEVPDSTGVSAKKSTANKEPWKLTTKSDKTKGK